MGFAYNTRILCGLEWDYPIKLGADETARDSFGCLPVHYASAFDTSGLLVDSLLLFQSHQHPKQKLKQQQKQIQNRHHYLSHRKLSPTRLLASWPTDIDYTSCISLLRVNLPAATTNIANSNIHNGDISAGSLSASNSHPDEQSPSENAKSKVSSSWPKCIKQANLYAGSEEPDDGSELNFNKCGDEISASNTNNTVGLVINQQWGKLKRLYLKPLIYLP
ncbi:unnamed protein product [Protopolystoma xenopodis]|uniref:Uncharacterized protein n=1 Tax=Protopolystoma xenopodis TaxID=117903 RepID=A0A3S5A622_9PLAT|nr:unnamed protein product [Protopolystoma xenopodis]